MPHKTALLLFFLLLIGCGAETAPETPTPPAPPPVEPIELAEALPPSLLGQDRQSLDTSVQAALGAEVTKVAAEYGDVTVSLTDFQTAEMTQMMGYAGLAASDERYLEHPVQRSRAAGLATTSILVGGRALVEVTAGSSEEADSALSELSLAALRR